MIMSPSQEQNQKKKKKNPESVKSNRNESLCLHIFCMGPKQNTPKMKDLSDLQIAFVPIISQFTGSEFFVPTRSDQKPTSSSISHHDRSREENTKLGLLRISIAIPADEEFGETNIRERLLDRVGEEVRTWLDSLYITDGLLVGEDEERKGKAKLPEVIPVIEYRTITWNAYVRYRAFFYSSAFIIQALFTCFGLMNYF